MALGTTNLTLLSGSNNLYNAGMDKDPGSGNVSLGACKFGQNDIDIGQYASSNPSMVKMSYWKSYDHQSLQFRFNPSQTLTNDTYKDTDGGYFGNASSGIAYNNNGATDNTNYWTFDGTNDDGYFDAVTAGTGYKQGTGAIGGTTVIAFWMRPNYRGNPASVTDVLANNNPVGSLSAYRGYRFVYQTDRQLRVLRGDGDGTASFDRRTFETSATLRDGEWNFIAWQGIYNSQTIGIAYNYFWTWNPTDDWSNGASFLSGTGGDLAYNSTDKLVLSGHPNSAYFNGDIGGIWVFNQSISTADINALKDNTDIYTA